MSEEHYIDVSQRLSYYTLNELTTRTKRVWLVLHGYGQLSKFFLKKFEQLDSEENFFIAPQGLSKFYLEGFTGRVGASWMTKEDRLTEIENQYKYIDEVLNQFEFENKEIDLVYFGFSQGVDTMCRYAAHAQLKFRKMILWAGTFPPDLLSEDFEYMEGNEAIHYFTGLNDPFFKEGMKEEQLDRIYSAMHLNAHVTEFEGKHEVIPELLSKL